MSKWIAAFEEEISAHRAWLRASGDHDRLSQWDRRLQDQTEPSICEALVRHRLAKQVNTVLPAEDMAKGGPDFMCISGNSRFYVESTCMLIEAVTAATNLQPKPTESGAVAWGPLTSKFLNECRSKTTQCSVRKDGPCVLAISTLHTVASSRCFTERMIGYILTSEPLITGNFDANAGKVVGPLYQSTDWKKSAFVRISKANPFFLEEASRSVSAMLLCGFGVDPPQIRGVIHPNPVRQFDAGLLPKFQFLQLVENADGTVKASVSR